MSGSLNGTAALISKDNPLALYLHCASHSLNLAVVKSLDEASIRNMIGVVNRVSIFFSAHPKRQRKLEEAIDQTQVGSAVKKLKDLCCTRWVERIDALDRFKKLHSSFVSCFETISDEGSRCWTPDSLTDASTLLLAISTTDFLSALVITSSSLSYLMALTKSLQSEGKDIVEAVSEIDNLRSVLQDLRDNVDKYHDEWFAEVEQMCTAVDTEPSLPRICARQTHRSNVPSQTPTEYYRRTITIPLLDHMLSEMDRRFSTHQQTAITGLYLVPSVLVSKTLVEVKSTLAKLGDMYSNDLPNPSSLQSEIHTWYLKWNQEKQDHGEQSLSTTLSFTLPRASSLFPNITELLRILCTLPVTSCSAERSFSGLKRIKTAPEVIDEFARRHPRRLELLNIYSS